MNFIKLNLNLVAEHILFMLFHIALEFNVCQMYNSSISNFSVRKFLEIKKLVGFLKAFVVHYRRVLM